MDGVTFFTDPSKVDFESFFSDVHTSFVVACPRRGSRPVNHKPISSNGGFFMLKPPTEMCRAPTHFSKHYGSIQNWVDNLNTEMEIFMRDLHLPQTAMEVLLRHLDLLHRCILRN